MKVTKLGHSCVLVETEDRIALFDPGKWAEKSLIDAVESVDKIVFTHEHPDHFATDILEELVRKHPDAEVICNAQIKTLIEDAGIDVTIREESQCTKLFTSPHGQLPVPGVPAPEENGYHFKDEFTHPGDSHEFSETKRVLAMPVIAPWGKTGDAVDKILELKPDYVLPIHDWHYHDEAREWLVGLLQNAMGDSGITILSATPGETFEL